MDICMCGTEVEYAGQKCGACQLDPLWTNIERAKQACAAKKTAPFNVPHNSTPSGSVRVFNTLEYVLILASRKALQGKKITFAQHRALMKVIHMTETPIMSVEIDKISKALAAAQSAINDAKKDADNPFFSSRYADLASVRDAIRAPFAANGLAYTQLVHTLTDGQQAIVTLLTHESGQWFRSTMVMPPLKKIDAQSLGSSITYGRRYALQAIAGIAADDDDGEAAMERDGKPRTEQQEKRQEKRNNAVVVDTPESLDSWAARLQNATTQEDLGPVWTSIGKLAQADRPLAVEQYKARVAALKPFPAMKKAS